MKSLTLKEKILYSFANMGIGTVTGIHMLYLVYFFFPPESSGIPYLIPQNTVIFGLTILGIILSISRIFDAMLDPVIANISDKLNHKLGKRIPMMRLAAIPFVFCYMAVFFVPVPEVSIFNVIWLFLFMLLGNICYTSYMIPFYSLMVDMAKKSEDKVDLGTISSAFWFVGFLLVSCTSAMWPLLTNILGFEKINIVRLSFLIIAFLGLICLLIPVFLLDAKKYETTELKDAKEKVIKSLRKVLKNKNFDMFLIANVSYTIATYIFETGLIYYITVLAGLSTVIQGPLTILIGALTLLSYPLVNKIAKVKGKKFLMRISLLMFSTTFIIISLFGIVNINIYILLGFVVLLSPFAQASFGILPHVITSDCAAYDRYLIGEDKSGMYMAANGFFVKLGGTLSAIIFTSFLVFGKDIGDDLGIRLAVLFAAVLALIGMFFMSKYDEKKIMEYVEHIKEEN